MLTLPIKKKYFDMICSGEKKEEYRNVTPYYRKRFETICGKENLEWIENHNRSLMNNEVCSIPFEILLRNGYNRNSPCMKIMVKLTIGCGQERLGAEKDCAEVGLAEKPKTAAGEKVKG